LRFRNERLAWYGELQDGLRPNLRHYRQPAALLTAHRGTYSLSHLLLEGQSHAGVNAPEGTPSGGQVSVPVDQQSRGNGKRQVANQMDPLGGVRDVLLHVEAQYVIVVDVELDV